MPQPTMWALELGTLDRDHPSFSGGNEAMMAFVRMGLEVPGLCQEAGVESGE